MTKTSQLQYSSSFKTYHLVLDSDSIQVAEQAWIESSAEYRNAVSALHTSFLSVSDDPQFSLSRFYKELVASPVRLRVTHSAKEMEGQPFELHDCSYLAIAVAILCDPWFVVGLESFTNNRAPKNPSYSPYCSFFIGENTGDAARIRAIDEDQLRTIYGFVHKNLALASWGDSRAKLLLLFLRCVVRTPYQRFTVLKLGLDHLFTEWDATVLNAALFFEYLFTNESEKPSRGVGAWNDVMPSTASVDVREIDVVFNYRHLVAHSNPTRAERDIETWMATNKINNEEAALAVRRTIYRTAKTCVRAIINNEGAYEAFLERRKQK